MDTLNINIPSKNITRSILELLNPYLGYLTPVELSLVDLIISNNISKIDSTTRAKIRGLSNLDKYTFNNYIKKLKDKQVLLLKDNILLMNPKIVGMTKSKSINVSFYE